MATNVPSLSASGNYATYLASCTAHDRAPTTDLTRMLAHAYLDHNTLAIDRLVQLGASTYDAVRFMNRVGAHLMAAAQAGDLEEVRALTPLVRPPYYGRGGGYDTGDVREILNPVFYEAAKRGHIAVVKYLLEHGATGRSLALRYGIVHFPVVEYLVEHGASDLGPALVDAAERGLLPTVQYLVEHGARSVAEARAVSTDASVDTYLQTVDAVDDDSDDASTVDAMTYLRGGRAFCDDSDDE